MCPLGDALVAQPEGEELDHLELPIVQDRHGSSVVDDACGQARDALGHGARDRRHLLDLVEGEGSRDVVGGHGGDCQLGGKAVGTDDADHGWTFDIDPVRQLHLDGSRRVVLDVDETRCQGSFTSSWARSGGGHQGHGPEPVVWARVVWSIVIATKESGDTALVIQVGSPGSSLRRIVVPS